MQLKNRRKKKRIHLLVRRSMIIVVSFSVFSQHKLDALNNRTNVKRLSLEDF
jgi:hypothetical protein